MFDRRKLMLAIMENLRDEDQWQNDSGSAIHRKSDCHISTEFWGDDGIERTLHFWQRWRVRRHAQNMLCRKLIKLLEKGPKMKIDASEFVENAAAWLPGIEMAAKLTGRRILTSIAAILRRAIDNPETKGQLIAWLEWLPVFSGEGEQAKTGEPPLPEVYADLLNEAIDFRTGCNCDDEDCPDPAA